MKIALLTARDPLQAADGASPLQLAARLAADHDVTLVLLEDAVVVARAGHRHAAELEGALGAGVQVLAEEEALARRAVNQLGDGVDPTTFDEVVDLVVDASDRQAWL